MDASATVTVMYSCHACGLVDRPVAVAARGDEDVIRWMEDTVRPALAADHAAKSVVCMSMVCDLKIPVPNGTDKIGGVVKH